MNLDDRARQLLAGPRGRRLCFELLGSDATGPPFWYGRPAPHVPIADVRAAGIEDLGAALARTDLGAVGRPERLDAALQASVDRAMYWQEPDEVDVVLADAEVAAHLAPVADAVARSAASRWWTAQPLDLTDQHVVAWPLTPGEEPVRPGTTGAREALASWRENEVADEERAARERPTDPRASWSGSWWSTPALAGLVATTRARPTAPRSGAGIHVPLAVPVGLTLVEDGMGWSSARTWPVSAPGTARVYEVTGPDAWTTLVEEHPLDVSAGRRHDWWRVSGWDGAWLVPDWSAVATRFDAVHLTVDGYLATAGRALAVDLQGRAAPARTMLAGWNPDATWWLADVLPEPGEPTDWRRQDGEVLSWLPAG